MATVREKMNELVGTNAGKSVAAILYQSNSGKNWIMQHVVSPAVVPAAAYLYAEALRRGVPVYTNLPSNHGWCDHIRHGKTHL